MRVTRGPSTDYVFLHGFTRDIKLQIADAKERQNVRKMNSNINNNNGSTSNGSPVRVGSSSIHRKVTESKMCLGTFEMPSDRTKIRRFMR